MDHFKFIKRLVPAVIKNRIRLECNRRRFPSSVLHDGARVGSDCTLGHCVVVFSDAKIELGTQVGRYSYVQSASTIWNSEIGAFCSIARDVSIGLVGHPSFMVSTNPIFYDNEQPLPRSFVSGRLFHESSPRTSVGADVWIGQGTMIKAGVTIGTGAVIGAGAIVTRNIAPYTIAAGNPCRPIRLRFSEELCQRLLDSRWWEFDDVRLLKLAPLFQTPEAFLNVLENNS